VRLRIGPENAPLSWRSRAPARDLPFAEDRRMSGEELTGQHPLVSGVRQLGFGTAAAAVTFGIGRLLGAAIR